jgi:hypothetical protein
MVIQVMLWEEDNGWWTASLAGKAAPLLRLIPGEPARRAEWQTREEAETELPQLLGHAIEVVKVIQRRKKI